MDIVKIGEVVEVNPANCSARVMFADLDNFISSELRIMQPATQKDKHYAMPELGEMVVCVFLPTGSVAGVILGSIYNDKDSVAVGDKNQRYTQFEDGTLINYNKESHVATADVKGDIAITANNITADVSSDVTITSKKATIKGSQEVHIKSTKINLGDVGTYGVVHQASPCPIYGVFHTGVSTVTKTD